MLTERKTTSRFAWLVLFVIGVTVVSFPLGYSLIAYQNLSSKLQTEAEINAKHVSLVIALNPEYWQFEEHRLAQYLAARPKQGMTESRRLININNETVAESIDKLKSPVITRSHELNDSGMVVGRLEITTSLRPLLIETGLIFLLIVPLGVAAFTVIYYIPIRQMYRAEKIEQESKEKLEMTYKELQVEVGERKLAEAAREQTISELRDALASVKQLSGLLPICSSCKKIRDDKGYWNQLEAYLSEHSGVVFTHGICPSCIQKLYPDINIDNL
jgi:cell division protein FtsL